ncbi:hypothetical protein [Robiginitomaculum antarcticum]|uniref:hypothetical protein n=1 Tax=Robiginitomaculum antarcticum TaxID=437507 RepID=UPI00036FB9A9|nr:hypothetical protein [Robiginitomaculum antarcticum]
MTTLPPAFDTTAINRAIARLTDTLGQMADDLETEPQPERMDKLARAISAQLKAHADLTVHNDRAAKACEQQKYTAYEDLPPPSPEDRKRFIERLLIIVDKIEAGQPVPDSTT